MRLGIVGCGVMGSRRAAIAQAAGDEVAVVADADQTRADGLAAAVGAEATTDWRHVAHNPSLEAVVVATPNKFLLPIAREALKQGKHVLCEKPLGRNAAEARLLVEAAEAAGRVLKTGFNLRHHPAIAEAHRLASQGAIGPLLGIRAAYGHGGRPGYDREWRADAELAGGGELLDQGVHVVDLCRWFLGDFAHVAGFAATWFWDVAPLEDNAFVLLRTKAGQVASIHTSWTQWRNLFRFEVVGRDGYLVVEGLGGSYGTEELVVGHRRQEGGVPNEERHSHPGEDVSWEREWQEFVASVHGLREPLGSGLDGLAAARIVDAVYVSARTGKFVSLGAST